MEKMPCSFEEFMELPQLRLTAPENTCAAFLCAVELFRRDKEKGRKTLNVLRGPYPLTGIDVQFVQDRLRGKGYLPMAYFRGHPLKTVIREGNRIFWMFCRIRARRTWKRDISDCSSEQREQIHHAP